MIFAAVVVLVYVGDPVGSCIVTVRGEMTVEVLLTVFSIKILSERKLPILSTHKGLVNPCGPAGPGVNAK